MKLEDIRTACPHCGGELHIDKNGEEFHYAASTLLPSLIESKEKFILYCDCIEIDTKVEGYVIEYSGNKILFSSIIIPIDNRMIGLYSFYDTNSSELNEVLFAPELISTINEIFPWNNLEEATNLIKRLLKMAMFS